MIFYLILFNQEKNMNLNIYELRQNLNITTDSEHDDLSVMKVKPLIESMCKFDPKKRINIHDVTS